jgi:hypothetical protein
VPENEAKEHALSRYTLRVVGAAGARGNSPAFALATAGSDPPEAGKQSARFFPPAPPMLGAGQWENQKLQTILSPLLGGYLRPPDLREEPHCRLQGLPFIHRPNLVAIRT